MRALRLRATRVPGSSVRILPDGRAPGSRAAAAAPSFALAAAADRGIDSMTTVDSNYGKGTQLILLGRAQGKLKGNVHHRAEAGTPMANVLLSGMHMIGLDDITQFGDSTGTFNL